MPEDEDEDRPWQPPPEPQEDLAVRRQKLREHVKINGPFPKMHIDLTGDQPKIYMEKADDIFGAKVTEIHHHEKREREVMEYCRVLVDMTFHGGDVLREGTILERLVLNEYEKVELRRYLEAGQQLVVVRWLGKPRMVPGDGVERATFAEFKEQTCSD